MSVKRAVSIVLVAVLLLAGGLSSFVAGAYAGAMRSWPLHSWPLRYPLKLLQRHGSRHIVAVPESRQKVETDGVGRLLAYPGKVEVACPEQGPRTAVLLIAGQSNAANSGGERHATRHPGQVVNFVQGRCFAAASPLLGANGVAGEAWTLLGDSLVESGAFDAVVLAPVAVGGTLVAQWAEGGAVNSTMGPLVLALATQYRVTHVLWHQGESDLISHTPADDYRRDFRSFVHTLRKQGVTAPVFVSVASRCGPGWTRENPVRDAQHGLAATDPGLRAGIDTDLLVGPADRYDDCHFAPSGQARVAEAWAGLLGAAGTPSGVARR